MSRNDDIWLQGGADGWFYGLSGQQAAGWHPLRWVAARRARKLARRQEARR